MQKARFRSLCWEDPLEKGTATTSEFWPGEFHGCIVHGVTKSRTRLSDFHFHGTIVNSILNGYMLNTFLAQFLNEISTPANMLCNIVLKFLGRAKIKTKNEKQNNWK